MSAAWVVLSALTFATSTAVVVLMVIHLAWHHHGGGHPSGQVPASRLRPPPGYGSFKPPNPVFDEPIQHKEERDHG